MGILDAPVSFPSEQVVNTGRGFFREDFTGNSVDTGRWTISPGATGSGAGAGMNANIANSLLTVTTGTTSGSETWITSRVGMQIPTRVQFTVQISQRIVNQNIYLELVNVAGDTRASWVFNGTSATTGQIESVLNGYSATAASNVTVTASGNYSIYELDARDDGVDWNERYPETGNSVSARGSRTRTTLIAGETYYPRIRVVNGTTAPASSTTVNIETIIMAAQSRHVVEIAAGRGQTVASEGVPVIGVGGTFGIANGTAIRPLANQQDETTAALAANATYTGTARDLSTDQTLRSTRIRWTYLANSATAGTIAHLYLDESTDGTTWRTTQQTPLPADNGYHTGEWPIGHMRYYRLRVINGAVAQTSLYLSGIQVRGDGSTGDTRANLPFQVTPVAGTIFAANASITTPTLDLGFNHQWDRCRMTLRNQEGTATGNAQFQGSLDGTTWWTFWYSTYGTFGYLNNSVDLGGWRYIRAIIANGATAATGPLGAAISLVSL